LAAPDDAFSASASLPVSLGGATVTVELDLRGTVDVAAERKRLEKDLAAAEKELAQCEAKLGNEGFLAKAPEQVVAGIRARREAALADIQRLRAQLDALPPA
jgi:valyl-tRNA synthetase